MPLKVTIPLINNPTGLDACIQEIQLALSDIPWLEAVFGRAWEQKEQSGKQLLRIPKVYLGNGEYFNVLPNDAYEAMCFFAAKDVERWPEYNAFLRNERRRPISIIFWFNLKEIAPEKDYIYTEELKRDVEAVLKDQTSVVSINGYVDERADQIYDAWSREALYAKYSVDDTGQYLMYPYSGFRFDITVSYLENC